MKLKPVLPPLDVNARYDIEEVCAYLRQSRAKTYMDIRSGRLETFLDGSRRYASGAAIAARCRPSNTEPQAA